MVKMDEANAVKPEKFSGEHFKRWQTQVSYWLTVLGLYSAIDGSESSQGSWMTKEQIEYHCYHRILSVLSDHLYDVYLTTTEKAKELWDLLEAEYGLDDAGVNRFAASSFNSYKMIDGKSIGDQIHEFKELLKGAEKSGTTFSEDFKVSCLIDKLPPSWLEFARSLRHKQGELTIFCEECGIVHEVTPSYSPQSNGVAERKNRTLMDMVNAMLLSSGLPESFWGEAILHACFILNRIIVKDNDKTPYEIWKKRTPKRKKIGPKTVDSVFLGYAHNSSAYRFLVTNSEVREISNNSIIESRDATFFEHIFPYKTRIPKPVSEIPSTSDNPFSRSSIVQGNQIESQTELRRSKRPRKEKNFGDGFYMFLLEGEPTTFKEAMSSVDAPFWKEVVNSEVESIMQNHTWEIVELPPGNKAIGCKWIFKKKLKPDGSIDKYKARLVAKGFTQKKGIDYFDTYSPVSSITTIRTLVALASIHNLVIHQMDVKTAFLNGDLNEEIYMEQPEGFIVKGQEHKVCKLVKSLYGLKQAPKQWHEKFDKVILDHGFRFNEHDKCLYYKETEMGIAILCLYVDDILIFGTNLEIVEDTKSYLSMKFDMKDLGEAYVILGMKLERTSQGITLSQSNTIEKMLKKFNYYNCNPVSTPYDPSVQLKKNNGEPVSQLKYSQLIGSLLYIANKSRPDIAYAVGRLSRYTHNPSGEHWTALERVFKYLRGTLDYSLTYRGFPAVVEGYSDANWITDNQDI